MLVPFTQAVREDWLDAYGHLNEAYYFVALTNACWDVLDQLGIGASYFSQTGCGIYTAESHLRFLKEVRAPAVLETRGMVLGFDAKRLRLGFVMSSQGIERATLESVYIHFDTKAGRAAAMSEEVQARLQAEQVRELPAWAGRSLSLEKR
jgi:acyl-CoA thioester hydrolase